MDIEKEKKKFIYDEISLLTMQGAFGRNKVYADNLKDDQKKSWKQYLKQEVFLGLRERYKGLVSDEAHIDRIEKLVNESNERFSNIFNGRFRIGTSQKLINLYLKYLWSLGYILRPPHCPFDSIVLKKLKLNISWVRSDDIDIYKHMVETAKLVAKQEGFDNIAEWELSVFSRDR